MSLTRKLSSKSLIKQNTSQDLSNSANQTITKDTFTASGLGPYSLTVSPGSVNNTQVYVNGVYQEKNNYTLNNNQITFTSPGPPSGTSIEVISGSAYNIGTPNDGSVDITKLAAQVAQALVPAGSVLAFGGTSAPSGYLVCDGQSYSTSLYPALFATIGYAHGGSGGNFNVPDYRGRFLRGVDGTAGRDPDKASRTAMNTGGNTGNNVGSVQGHAFTDHTHTYIPQIFSHDEDENGNTFSSYKPGTTANTGSASTGAGTETRPINAYVNYIIKT